MSTPWVKFKATSISSGNGQTESIEQPRVQPNPLEAKSLIIPSRHLFQDLFFTGLTNAMGYRPVSFRATALFVAENPTAPGALNLQQAVCLKASPTDIHVPTICRVHRHVEPLVFRLIDGKGMIADSSDPTVVLAEVTFR